MRRWCEALPPSSPSATLQAPPKGEVTLVVAGAARDVDEEAAIAAVQRLVAAGARTKDAAAVVAELTGTRTNALYRAIQER